MALALQLALQWQWCKFFQVTDLPSTLIGQKLVSVIL